SDVRASSSAAGTTCSRRRGLPFRPIAPKLRRLRRGRSSRSQLREGLSVHHRRFRAFAPALLAVALAAVVAATATAAPSPRATLTGSVPPWATSSNFKSATAGSDAVGFRVYLGWRGDAAATAAAVATPGSASYGKYLTPQQFR